MRSLFMAGRELSYPRNAVLLQALREMGEVDAIGVQQRPRSLWQNSLRVAWQALPRLASGKYDLVFVGFYGHLLMLAAGLFARRPIVFDAFVSTYDTLVEDRQVIGPGSLAAKLAFWLDRQACRPARRVLLDTPLHRDYFRDTFQIPEARLDWLPVGCREDLFFARPAPAEGLATSVLYYSSYLPLHGAETVVRAAHLLREEPISFRLIGEGQEFASVQRLASELGLARVEFCQPVALENLPGEIARADVCLGGHFGGSAKAGRVVPGKVYQILAMGRPLVAGDTPANRALLRHGEHALLSPPGDAEALAGAVLRLHGDRADRERLGQAGRELYERACSEAVIRRKLRQILAEL